tara:strand:- start:157 stop:408 length:252 start_codon:yes stop_codon:yes gene_type:complete
MGDQRRRLRLHFSARDWRTSYPRDTPQQSNPLARRKLDQLVEQLGVWPALLDVMDAPALTDTDSCWHFAPELYSVRPLKGEAM